MSAIAVDQLKVTAPWEIQAIYELKIMETLNQHGELYIKIVLTEAAGKKAGLWETTNDQIMVYHDDGTTKKWIFKGRLKEVNVSQVAGVCMITALFLSETVMLDRQEKRRSFQNTSLTYDQIVTKVLSDYPGKSMELTAEKKVINGPIIQYQETDWQFIRRLASYLETVIVPDSTMEQQIFSFGYPTGRNITLSDTINYATGKDIKAYYDTADVNPGIPENQFSYYEVETYESLTIGDTVTFKGQEMQVSSVYIELKQGLLVYHTTLVKKSILRQNPIYNKHLQGLSLKGTVLEGQGQQVKLHLDIDAEQNVSEAYWYPFAPSTTDALYLMPQKGTIATLYIPSKQEQKAIITGCLRTNGVDCEQTSDPNTRYLATEYGQELKLAPGGIYFTAGNDDLCLDFDDQEGVIIKSHKGMTLEAEEEIIFESEKKVVFSSANQILMATLTGNLVMENELHLRAPKVDIECTDDTKFTEVEDENKEESKGGIDWGGMLAKAKGAVATWWDNLKGEEVFLGTVQAAGGVYETMMGGGMVAGACVGEYCSVGLGTVPCVALAATGAYVITDGLSNIAGGVSRVWNGLCGNTKGDTANFVKNRYIEGGNEEAYNQTQIALGMFSLLKTAATTVRLVPFSKLGISNLIPVMKQLSKKLVKNGTEVATEAFGSFCDTVNTACAKVEVKRISDERKQKERKEEKESK